MPDHKKTSHPENPMPPLAQFSSLFVSEKYYLKDTSVLLKPVLWYYEGLIIIIRLQSTPTLDDSDSGQLRMTPDDSNSGQIRTILDGSR